MGLIVLIVIGGVLGWLAAIVMRWDDRQGMLLNVSFGIAGALVAGLISNSGPILLGLSASALLIALAGALVVLAALNVYRNAQAR